MYEMEEMSVMEKTLSDAQCYALKVIEHIMKENKPEHIDEDEAIIFKNMMKALYYDRSIMSAMKK